jgi:multidrug resistance efflux pump
VVALVAVLGLAGAAAGAGLLRGFLPHPVVAEGADAGGGDRADTPVSVKAVRPKRDPSFRVTNQQLATVEAYYEAGLRARASGVVREVTHDIGEPVRAGDLLVVIDAPDLEQAVDQKGAVIVQRLREVQGAEADVESAKAEVELAKASIRQKEADVTQAENTRLAKQKRLARVKVLVAGGSVTPDVEDEADLDARAAAAGVESARAAAAKAAAELTDRISHGKKAAADLEIKRALVEVARHDRAVAAAQFGFAQLRSPFDGVVSRRVVDPGVFVQNATTGASEPLITVSRTDLVTAVMRLPDAAAAYLGPHTEAEVRFDQLPGVVVRGPVTRFSPAINPADRTARVEVDVFNGSPEEYHRLLARELARTAAPLLAPVGGYQAAAAAGASRLGWPRVLKSGGWSSVLVPDWSAAPPGARVVPGMTGTMRVYLDNIAGAYLVPATAVFTRGGMPAVMLVENGRTRVAAVTVQVNDGRVAKLSLRAADGRGPRELTGDEILVAARQAEVGDRERVTPVVEEW